MHTSRSRTIFGLLFALLVAASAWSCSRTGSGLSDCDEGLLLCGGASDCSAGEVCCRDYEVDPYGATCTSSCADTVLCSQSADCPVSAPYCCPSGGMVTTNLCDPNPC